MRVCPDAQDDGWLWVDREIDGRADHFFPCPACDDEIAALGRPAGWHEFDLCPSCDAHLEISGAISDVLGQRPMILEPGSQRRALTEAAVWPPLAPGNEPEPLDPRARLSTFREFF